MQCKATTKLGSQCKKKSSHSEYCYIHKHVGETKQFMKKINRQTENLKILNNKIQNSNKVFKENRQLNIEIETLTSKLKDMKLANEKIKHHEHIEDIIHKYEHYNEYIKKLYKITTNKDDWSIYKVMKNNVCVKIVNYELNIDMKKFVSTYENLRVERNKICHPSIVLDKELLKSTFN